MKQLLRQVWLIIMFLAVQVALHAQTTGTAYRDYNGNGSGKR